PEPPTSMLQFSPPARTGGAAGAEGLVIVEELVRELVDVSVRPGVEVVVVRVSVLVRVRLSPLVVALDVEELVDDVRDVELEAFGRPPLVVISTAPQASRRVIVSPLG